MRYSVKHNASAIKEEIEEFTKQNVEQILKLPDVEDLALDEIRELYTANEVLLAVDMDTISNSAFNWAMVQTPSEKSESFYSLIRCM